MTRKQRRLYFVVLGLLAVGAAAALVLTALRDDIVFFFSPTEIVQKAPADGRRIRLGGLVETGSVARQGATVTFKVTDGANAVPVTYTGVLPDLFREGQGVVTEGRFEHGAFQASEVLAKHDEKYMPKEVVDALKKSGQWQESK